MAPSQPSVRLLLLPLIKSRFLVLLILPLVVLILYKNQLSKPPSLKVKVKEAPQGGSWEALADVDDDWGIHEGSWGGGVKDWFGWRDKGRTSIIITGGAGQLAQALIPELINNYTVHVQDIVPRPPSLPSSVIYHRSSLSPAEAYKSIFTSNIFDGVIHLAGISLDAWCAAKEDECHEANVGGTKALMDEVIAVNKQSKRGKMWKNVRVPWVILGSTMEVFGPEGTNEDSPKNPTSAIGRTKLEAEQVFEEAILDDASEAIFYIEATPGEGVSTINLVSGQRTPARDIVELVRKETTSMSPVRDIGHNRNPSAHEYSRAKAAEILGWQAEITPLVGLGKAITQLTEDIGTYFRSYLHEHCPPSADFPASDNDLTVSFIEDERNKPLWKLAGCTVNLGFNHEGWFRHLKCQDGKHCKVDDVKVAALNWNQSTFIIEKVGKKQRERVVRVMLREQTGMGYLGMTKTEGEVGLELYKDSKEGQTVFDLEVRRDSSSLRLLVPDSEMQLHAIPNNTDGSTWFTVEPITRWVDPHFDMRINVLCCPFEGDWPLLLDDSLEAHPNFVKVHVADGYKGQEEIEAASCHKLQETSCFSADSIMYRALRHMSVLADEAELVVVPVYQQCKGTQFLLHDAMHHASETIQGVKNGEKKVALVLTHDWGICVDFAWDIWSARGEHALHPDGILNNVLVWSVMGDYDSPCYRPHQDVVIPARTCRSNTLRETFPNVGAIKPMRERSNLLMWSGTHSGTGKSERIRLTCNRGGAGDRELIKGGGKQSNFASSDYMKDLNNARFCPQPRGIAGWSPQTSDAIYAGCIPVFISEGTHYPFADFLDWSKLSVRVAPTELDKIEKVLAAIPLSKVEELQANLVSVREAFLYSGDEKPEDELERRGPMFFALHEAGMRIRTRYPVKGAE
ncbi:hypothetical protein I307_00539 [Cryptococcus deuterogattii 99/473]|uniref:Exostosin GT47 domain-containing protein n=1 Tax=Cryptococcus deuterogattii Ram5 TaxID=1296110 RepID=A0A0D0U0R0_9TREE|nr:hypothetical protein I313_01953 [Cryptococcus deuterogattii Ram5]KIY60093.1 hypothetical protein I307_00539 [Cryptococcus deuterogattii 99/473]